MQRFITRLIAPFILIVYLFSSCAPTVAPTLVEETPCAGVTCLPPTLTPVSKPEPTLTPTVTIGVVREIARGAKITFWHAYPLTSAELIDTLVTDFNKNNPDVIKVEARGFYSDEQLLDAISSSKELPDVIMGENGLLQQLETEIGLTDLLNYVSDPSIGIPGEQQQAISQEAWKNLTNDGKMIGLPAQKNVFFLLYNNSWAKLLGYDSSPKMFEDFVEQSKAGFEANIAHENKSYRGTGGWVIDIRPETALAWMGPDFDHYLQENVFSQQTVLATFDELKQIQNAGYAWIGKNNDPIPYFVSRLALFISASSHELPEMVIHMKALKMADDWSIIPYPHLSENAGNVTNGYSYGIPAKEQDKQMAGWLFIQWMMDAEHQAYIGSQQYTIPEDQTASDRLHEFSSEKQIMDALSNIAKNSSDMPNYPAWIYGNAILEDGLKQVFQTETTVDDIPDIIDDMNNTFIEMLRMEELNP